MGLKLLLRGTVDKSFPYCTENRREHRFSSSQKKERSLFTVIWGNTKVQLGIIWIHNVRSVREGVYALPPGLNHPVGRKPKAGVGVEVFRSHWGGRREHEKTSKLGPDVWLPYIALLPLYWGDVCRYLHPYQCYQAYFQCPRLCWETD